MQIRWRLWFATSAAQAVGAHRYAGGSDHFSAGGDLCGGRAKEQFRGLAISDAMAAVRDTMTAPIPVHLQDAHYKSSQKLGHGVGYKYAHDYRIIM